MSRINRWKLADELNVFQISLLISGYDPSEFERDHYDRWPDEVKVDISPYLNAIKNTARSKRFKFSEIINHYNDYDEIDWHNSLVTIDSFIVWLRSRNFSDGFFLDGETEADLISAESSEFYAPKLAAAVCAWKEVTSNPEALNGKTPKRALEIWLREHAAQYGLTNKDGNPNELGIEEICKVANWKPSGGASPTPTPSTKPSLGLTVASRKVRPKAPTSRIAHMIDDDIPF